ncbi:hypothetical protein EW145_g2259 [Phellinidium pouzarii]|uniref:Pseudouridine synthase RsuA/RluA-like domain-containing protein n=1 Tax=Phellinidium pouzarii TaxID=167371 RepID=A0A4S4LBI9_9AGAM|nr:hypothetical protein EW145_g2259 [Phellinidium pouzarii]
MAMAESNASESYSTATAIVRTGRPRLKKIPPYWYPYRTNAKARWFDREILEVISTEFRDRSVEYYRYALQSGVTTINGKIALPGTIIRNGDTLEHEPPVTSTPVEILHHDKDREFVIINKPGSIPVHAAGRYFKNSLVEILKDDFGFPNVYTVNRLDRLTSGLMIIALSADRARTLTSEFTSGTIRKEYVARVQGEFPVEEITCEQPLLTVDRQMGLNIVHPEGKEAKTLFKRMHYDKITNTSVVHCRPLTGRSHQIRVHLQYLGHPIANDAVYADAKIWGPLLGKSGIDLSPSNERKPPKPPLDFAGSTAEGHGCTLPDLNSPDVKDTANDVRDGVPETVAKQGEGRELSIDFVGSTPELHGCNLLDLNSENAIPGTAEFPRQDIFRSTDDQSSSTKSTEALADAEMPVKTSSIPSPRAPRPTSTKSKDKKHGNPAFRTKEESAALRASRAGQVPTLLPRETGHDIGLGAPVPLSIEAVDVITRLRNQKDEDEDWSRWRDVVFRAKGSLHPPDIARAWAQQKSTPNMESKRRKAKKMREKQTEEVGVKHPEKVARRSAANEVIKDISPDTDELGELSLPSSHTIVGTHAPQPEPDPAPATPDIASLVLLSASALPTNSNSPLSESGNDALYCPECYLPLHPDPKPEKLYIFLHALRYTSTSLGAFETSLPEWAAEGYVWE